MQKETTQTEIKQKEILTPRTGRFYSIKSEGHIDTIWFVLHGYGQLAGEFLKNFEKLDLEKTLIVAPEALNKFYLKGHLGKTGTCWMTKEDRENEIKDYINFLNNVYSHITAGIIKEKLSVNVLGFSQGAATAARWALSNKFKPDNLVLWGETLPRDIDTKRAGIFFKSTKLTIVIGKEDKFVKDFDVEAEEKYLKENRIDYEVFQYYGKHEIDNAALTELFNKLEAAV